MSQATVSSKGQITLPVSLRKALNLKAGDKVELSAVGNRAMMSKVRKGDIFAFAEKLELAPGPGLTDHEADLIVQEQATMNYDRKRREGRA